MSPNSLNGGPDQTQLSEIHAALGCVADLIADADFRGATVEELNGIEDALEATRRLAEQVLSSCKATVPAGLYECDLVSYSDQTAPAPEILSEIVSLSDNDTAFNATLDFIVDNYARLFTPLDLLEHLSSCGIDVGRIDQAAPKLIKLLNTWKTELSGYLVEEGLLGGWLIEPSSITYAPFGRIAKKIPSTNKTAEEVEAIAPEITDQPQELDIETRMPEEDELSSMERRLMTQLSQLSVCGESNYPTKTLVIEAIVRGNDMSYDRALALVDGLVERKFLFKYRLRGENYVTTNANVAVEYKRRRKKTAKIEIKDSKEVMVDVGESANLVSVLMSTGKPEQKYTIQYIWAKLQARNGKIVHQETPTEDEIDAIRETAKQLSKLGILFAGQYKAQTKGARHSARRTAYKIGFEKGRYQEFRNKEPHELKSYIQSLVDIHNINSK